MRGIPDKRFAGWLVTAVMLAVPCLPAFDAQAGSTGFTGNRPVTLKDFLPHKMSVEGYSEQWAFTNILGKENGTERKLAFQIMITNVGIGDHKGKLELTFIGPGGSRIKHGKKCNVRSRIVDGRAELGCGGMTIKSTLTGYTATYKSRELTAEVKVKNQVPPWRPGNGRIVMDRDGEKFYDLLLTVPRGHAQVSVNKSGAEWSSTGIAFADHSYFSVTPDESTKSMIRFKRMDEQMSLLFSSLVTPDRKRFGYVLAATDDGSFLASARPTIEIKQAFPAPNRKRYSLPNELKIAIPAEGGNALEVHILGGYIKKVKDLLGGLSAIEKLVAKRFSDPFTYSMSGVFRVGWQRSGKAPIAFEDDTGYLVQHVNP